MSDIIRDKSWFSRDRFGMFIHFGIYSLAARHEWVKNYEQMSDGDYRRYFDHFYPDLFNPRKWAAKAREAGMKYVVITTKHHDGFCLWDTEYTDYKAPKTRWGKDVLSPLVDAFRAEGLKIGFYYSLLDWHHADFPVDSMHPQREDDQARAANPQKDIKRYAEYMRCQLSELLSNFGPIDLMWFDFSYPGKDGKGRNEWESDKLLDIVRTLQPQALVNNRLDLPEGYDFITPEQHQPDGIPVDGEGKPVYWEACQTLSGSWGYHRDELTWKSVPQLLAMLVDGVAKGGNLLLNVGPTARGELDRRALDRLEGIGQWMHGNERSIYGCGPAPEGFVAPVDTRFTYNAETNRLYLHFFRWPFKHVHIPNLAGRVEYAQFLHDASEVLIRTAESEIHPSLDAVTPPGALTLELPVVKPEVEVPVVELFLRPDA